MLQTPVSGKMVEIDRIRIEEEGNFYMDVWFMSTELSDETDTKLRNLEIKDGVKCCWNAANPTESLKHYFTGFARTVQYADYDHEGEHPEYAFKFYEG